MGLWNSLFGGGRPSDAAAPSRSVAEEEYKGFVVRAVAMTAGGEHQLAGEVSKTVDGATRTYKFVRADKFASADDATSASLGKGRQLIDEQGDKLFSQTWP